VSPLLCSWFCHVKIVSSVILLFFNIVSGQGSGLTPVSKKRTEYERVTGREGLFYRFAIKAIAATMDETTPTLNTNIVV
jgi:hypothetical protein